MNMEDLFAGLVNSEGVFEREEVAIDPGIELWLPPFFTEGEQERVVDPTGGGNAFLGGMAVALARGRLVEEAAAWGSVAASFAIEQVGMPSLEGGDEESEGEKWNGESVEGRLEEFLGRVRR
jgi:hypothetical protein